MINDLVDKRTTYNKTLIVSTYIVVDVCIMHK